MKPAPLPFRPGSKSAHSSKTSSWRRSAEARRAKPRILFLINSLAGGGAERVLTTILEYSAGRRSQYDIHLALLDEEAEAYPPPNWVHIWRLDAARSLLKSIRRTRTLIRLIEPDVTVSFLTRANVANVVGHIGRHAGVVISERVHTAGHLGGGMTSGAAKSMIRFTYPRADRVIAVSHGVRAHLIEDFQMPPERVAVIFNPLDLRKIETLARLTPSCAPSAPYFVAMGRLVENKNFELLIRAFAASDTQSALVIAGEGPDRARLERLTASLGLEGRVFFPGFVANPYPLMRHALFHVLPSNAEGFPNGLVEAMALGLPVISTDCRSGPAEILEGKSIRGRPVDARWGVLVATGDVGALKTALEGFSSPNRREHFSRLSKQRAQSFGVEQAVDAYWDVIQAAHRSPAPLAGRRRVALA